MIRSSILPALLFLLAGCTLDSASPLGDPDKAKVDERVLGKWRIMNKEALVHSLRAEKLSAAGYPAGTLKLTLGHGGPESENHLLAFCTELKGRTYVHLCGTMVAVSEPLPAWDKVRGTLSILKYAVAGEMLTLYQLNASPLDMAVAKGELKGELRNPGGKFNIGPEYRVTDTTANLAQFVADADEKLFSGPKGVFTRVK